MSEKKSLRAIIADDETHIRLLIKKVLSSIGITVIGEAKNGLEAVELYKTLKPEVVFLDINMPLKTGDSALRDIMEFSPEASVIMLTSVADVETVEKCIGDGAINFIRKDTPISAMRSLISETLEL